MTKNLYEETCKKEFSTSISNKLISKLNTVHTNSDYRSIITEIHFGKFLNSFGFPIEYEPTIKGERNSFLPDWKVSISELNYTLFEVYRLGMTEKDQLIEDIANLLSDYIVSLSLPMEIELKISENEFNLCLENIKEHEKLINSWFDGIVRKGDSYSLNKGVSIIIKEIDETLQKTIVSYATRVDSRFGRIHQNAGLSKDNRITKKVKQIDERARQIQKPFILCIEIDQSAGLGISEIISRFLFSSCECRNTRSGDKHRDNTSQKCSIRGEFYKYKFLSGILVKVGIEFSYIENPLQTNLIRLKDYSLIRLYLNRVSKPATNSGLAQAGL